MTKLAIIGAGLSGRLLAMNLVQQGTSALSVRMIDRGARYMGPAYSNEADYLLLNVPAAKMGAFSEDPEHFLAWAQVGGNCRPRNPGAGRTAGTPANRGQCSVIGGIHRNGACEFLLAVANS